MATDILAAAQDTRRRVVDWRRGGLTVGFVPTMGALHEGHLSLLRASAAECDRTVVSVYVNPTQFGPGEDFGAYPRRPQADADAAARAGADLVFAPADAAMYPDGFCTHVTQEGLTDVLEGAARPGHFRGVLTVVLKLLNLVPCDRAYFGHKDFQQTVVIRRMVTDLSLPVDIRVMPTVREADGLAMSSRNERLTPRGRAQAVCLHEALEAARQSFSDGERSGECLRALMKDTMAKRPDVQPQYAEIVSPETLQPVVEACASSVAVLAAIIDEVRLIDNACLGERDGN